MVDDSILSKQAAYIYQYAVGFEPVEGNLQHWRGTVYDSQNNSAELIVTIPDDFPYTPPELQLGGNTIHPISDNEGKISTRTLTRWDSNNNVYTVIKEAIQGIKSAPFGKYESPNSKQEIDSLQNQISTLKAKLQQKKQEYQELKENDVQIDRQQTEEELVEDKIVEIENELFALEESYDNLEIKAINFAKKFVDLRKRYYLIQENNAN